MLFCGAARAVFRGLPFPLSVCHGSHCRVPVLADLAFLGAFPPFGPGALDCRSRPTFFFIAHASWLRDTGPRSHASKPVLLRKKKSRSSRYASLMSLSNAGLFPRLEAHCDLVQHIARTSCQSNSWRLEFALPDVCGRVMSPA